MVETGQTQGEEKRERFKGVRQLNGGANPVGENEDEDN